MNINGIQGLLGQAAQQGLIDKLSNRLIGRKDTDGDGRLNMRELAGNSGTVRQEDLDKNSYPGEKEFFSVLNQTISDKMVSPGTNIGNANDFKSALGALKSNSSPPNVGKLTQEIFSKVDDNKDGLLSGQEMGGRADMFAFADENGDGSISIEETQQALHNPAEIVNSLKSYAQGQNTTLKGLIIDKFTLSEDQANKVLEFLENNSLDVVA